MAKLLKSQEAEFKEIQVIFHKMIMAQRNVHNDRKAYEEAREDLKGVLEKYGKE